MTDTIKVPTTPTIVRNTVRDLLDAITIIERDIVHARARLTEWSADGLTNGGDSGHPGGHSDPVAQTVCGSETRDPAGNHTGWRPTDEHHHRLTHIDRRILIARALLQEAAVDITNTVRRTDLPEPDGCYLCARYGHDSTHAWQPIKVRRHRPGTDSLKIPYCAFHHEFADRYGVDAGPAVTTWHLEHLGARIPKQLIREHHTAAFEKAQRAAGAR